MTKKQKLFIEEYLIDLNATQSAIRAGYSSDTAYSIGQENLKKPEIKNHIDKALAERSRRTGISQDRVIQELARIAFVKMTDVVDPDTCQIRYDATDDDIACIEGIKYKRSESETGSSIEREVKFASKLKALEHLGKHLGMFREKVDLTVDASGKLDDILSQMGGEGLDE